ncbi:MAG: SDR family NAD(P)-dependent oxidoreductase [Clostridiaceae bacterium]|nr:SDR family NAD(P)-dependent oxidoreductase [Eubacteriales bacterium]
MKTVVITGATSGIGFAAAKAFSALGWRVIGVGRDERSCDRAQQEIRLLAPDAEATYFAADLANQNEAARAADVIGGYLCDVCGGRLEALINNAGGVRSVYTTTAEGYEQQFALNHLAGVLFTYKLFDCLKAANGRVLFTGSNSHKHMRAHFEDIMLERHYSCLTAYKHTKLLTMLFARAFNNRFAAQGVRAYVVDPGLVNTNIGLKQTGGLVRFVWELRRRGGCAPELPAQTHVYLASSMPAPEGFYYYRCAPRAYSRRAKNDADAKRVFELSERFCGIRF